MEAVLSESDKESFRSLGYAVVKGAFSSETAKACSDLIWEDMERDQYIKRHDASTWPAVKCALEQTFHQNSGVPWCNVYTPRLLAAIDEICGLDTAKPFGCGWWMITFPASSIDIKGQAPPQWAIEGAWHVDGHWFDHYLHSPEVGLVVIMLFSDIRPNGGGTALAEGSHIDVIQSLCEHGLDGCRNTALARHTLRKGHVYDIVEVTGDAGDVVLLHPLLLHARSSNLSTSPPTVRIIAHPRIPLKAPLNLLQPRSLLECTTADAVMHMANGFHMLKLLTPENVVSHLKNKEGKVQCGVRVGEGASEDSELYRHAGPSHEDAKRIARKVRFSEIVQEHERAVGPCEPSSSTPHTSSGAADEFEDRAIGHMERVVAHMERDVGFTALKYRRKY